MALFEKETEEEKNYKDIEKAIRSSNWSPEDQSYMIQYIDRVQHKQWNNDFFETDFLSHIIIEMLTSFDYDDSVVESFKQYISFIPLFFPEGEKTENYQATKEMFLQNFCGKYGLINNGLFDKVFYHLFQNRYDYLYIMNLIMQDDQLLANSNHIFRFGVSVSPFCVNQQTLQNEILSYMNGLSLEVGTIEEYTDRKLLEAKKRSGVYPMDEKTLANISKEAEKAKALIAKLDILQRKITDHEKVVDQLTATSLKEVKSSVEDGKKEISQIGTTTTMEMKNYVAKVKQEILEQLDDYILSLQANLKESSDQIFQTILNETQEKLQSVRLMSQGLSQTATSELLRIRTATEESVSKLKAYVENEPELQKLLQNASQTEEVKEAILQLHTGQQGKTPKEEVPHIVVAGNDRLVVPANPSVILPKEEGEKVILPAFDESIPFEKRIGLILEEKKQRENQGEIFHELTEEVIRCILEGDWVYLWGPSGCGKSYTIKQAANLIGIDVVDNGKITDKYSIMAYNDPQGRFRATQCFVSLVYGKLLLLDEFDNGNSDTQVVLNELYSGLLDTLEKPEEKRYVTFAEDMTVPVNSNFRMIAAGNTSGAGENQAFSSRGKIDESVQQRMTPKRFWYDNRVEEQIFGEYTNWYNIFVNFRKACDKYANREGLDSPIGIVTTRDASAIVKYIGHNSKNVNQVLREKFVQTKESDYLNYIMGYFQEQYEITSVKDEVISTPLAKVNEKTIAKQLVLECQKTGGK